MRLHDSARSSERQDSANNVVRHRYQSLLTSWIHYYLEKHFAILPFKLVVDFQRGNIIVNITIYEIILSIAIVSLHCNYLVDFYGRLEIGKLVASACDHFHLVLAWPAIRLISRIVPVREDRVTTRLLVPVSCTMSCISYDAMLVRLCGLPVSLRNLTTLPADKGSSESHWQAISKCYCIMQQPSAILNSKCHEAAKLIQY